MNILKVITPDNLGKGITFNPQTKKWEVQSGFDCESISALPSKPWKKGTTLLAKQDGECIQLAALDSIFQEIGVGIAADKTSAFTGETYNVTVTVTNTGESKNELTNLTVQKPLLGNYEIQDVRTSKQGVDEVETLDQLNYNLKGLAKGGTFILRFSVKANDVGTYQFSATVNPNSALDQNAKNNTDTIILKANTKIDTTYVPSVDCPRITATELDSNTVLAMMEPRKDGWTDYKFVNDESDKINIFANRENLKGLKIRISGASTVIVLTADNRRFQFIRMSNNGIISTRAGGYLLGVDADTVIPAGSSPMPFSDGILHIDKDCDGALVLCRPAGKNCRWQAFAIRPAIQPKNRGIVESNVQGFTVRREPSIKPLKSNRTYNFNIIPNSVEYEVLDEDGYHTSGSRLIMGQKLVLTAKRGTAASADIDINANQVPYAKIPMSVGKTSITDTRVTVAADATSTDSVNSEFIQVIVED
jgi:hypothetical protein